jgi:hypothetical protein
VEPLVSSQFLEVKTRMPSIREQLTSCLLDALTVRRIERLQVLHNPGTDAKRHDAAGGKDRKYASTSDASAKIGPSAGGESSASGVIGSKPGITKKWQIRTI